MREPLKKAVQWTMSRMEKTPVVWEKSLLRDQGKKKEATCGKPIQKDKDRGPEVSVIRQKKSKHVGNLRGKIVLVYSEEERDEWM